MFIMKDIYNSKKLPESPFESSGKRGRSRGKSPVGSLPASFKQDVDRQRRRGGQRSQSPFVSGGERVAREKGSRDEKSVQGGRVQSGGVEKRDERGVDKSGEYLVVEDRKSTRLNSSHVSISYAVFCLKKKIIPGGVVEVTALSDRGEEQVYCWI